MMLTNAIVIIAGVIAIYSIYFLRKHSNKEHFHNFARYYQPNNIMIDTKVESYVWKAVMPLEVYDQCMVNNKSIPNYLIGTHYSVIQNALKSLEPQLNINDINNTKKYEWKQYKPRFVGIPVIDACFNDFFTKTGIWEKLDFKLITYRITHANISSAGDFLLTIDFIIYKEANTYGFVLNMTVLFSYTETRYIVHYHSPKVVGLIHSQYIQKIASLDFTSSIDAHN